MPEIVDTLTIPIAEAATFTATSGADFANFSYPAGDHYAINAAGNNQFIKGDSLRIISAGIVMPESFTWYQSLAAVTVPVIAIVPRGVTSGHLFTNPNLASGQQFMPMENYESVLDVFMSARETIDSIDPTKTLLNENYRIKLYFAAIFPVSMLGLPAALDTKSFYIGLFLKVQHNFKMV
jgi:hypothetical protein